MPITEYYAGKELIARQQVWAKGKEMGKVTER
jgi:hypothetical protein